MERSRYDDAHARRSPKNMKIEKPKFTLKQFCPNCDQGEALLFLTCPNCQSIVIACDEEGSVFPNPKDLSRQASWSCDPWSSTVTKPDLCNLRGYSVNMIKSFKHKGLEDYFYTGTKKGIRPEHASKIGRILDRLNAAQDIIDMNYPGSFLHKLCGDSEGQYSVGVSGNWRIYLNL